MDFGVAGSKVSMIFKHPETEFVKQQSNHSWAKRPKVWYGKNLLYIGWYIGFAGKGSPISYEFGLSVSVTRFYI